jgi:hypothetical protein
LKKRKGDYSAFPTLIRQQMRLWMACRSGAVSGRQAHGVAGKVLLFSADAATPDNWSPQGTLFMPAPDGCGNELDAILSAPCPDLFFLATRDYEYKKRNDVYLSTGSTPDFRHRRLLTEISDHYAICFGHVRRTVGGDFLMPGYCGFSDEPSGTPVLLVSENQGGTWSLRAKVASSTKVGTRLTEYSLGHLGGSNWMALIRNETPPFPLFWTESHDDGRTWGKARKTTLCGHAPMILDVEGGGGHLVLYRDLAESEPGVGIGISLDRGASWQRIGRLAAYTGSIYDGGYGDLVHLADDRYLAVYYLCDEDGSPWIEGSIFSIE